MNVTVSKSPDGVAYMTKDGHDELFAGTVGEKPAKVSKDVTVAVVADSTPFAEEGALAVRFSWVDYLDTSTPGVAHPDGVRHAVERPVPGRYAFGPYVVDVGPVE
jgi:hypothetical protein